MAIKLQLMPDYECFPLWGMDVGQIGNVDPEILPISEDLKEQLIAWGDKYTATLNRADPASSGFKNPESKQAFDREGLELWQRLQRELGPDYRVSYYSTVSGKELPPGTSTSDS